MAQVNFFGLHLKIAYNSLLPFQVSNAKKYPKRRTHLQPSASERHAIITGGTSGIGKSTALELAMKGMSVTIACRDKERGILVADEISHLSRNSSIRPMVCDLSSFASIVNFVKEYKDIGYPLHVLINNAGIMACPQSCTKDGFEMQFGVNHLGHFLLTSLLVDTLKSSASPGACSRVVVLASAAEHIGNLDFNDLNFKISRGSLLLDKQRYRKEIAHGVFHMEPSISQPLDPNLYFHQEQWIQEQELLKKRLVLKDDFSWKIHPVLPSNGESGGENILRYIGGVDLSFSKDDSSIACGALVVVDLDTLCVVYEDFDIVHLTMPYVPGFLAFRELLMVDGNGILHPRGFGLASHLGVLSDLPSIGIGKNLHHVDGLTHEQLRRHLPKNTNKDGDAIPLTGKSGQTWGVAFRYNEQSSKPIFISVGHRISLETSIAIVRMCCKYRVPEPIRQADIRSKEYLQKKHGDIRIP